MNRNRRWISPRHPLIASLVTGGIAGLLFCGTVRADETGAEIFARAKCPICHGKDGSGNTPAGKKLKARDLRSAEVRKKDDRTLVESISKGKGKMPAFGDALTPQEIMKIVAHIRELGKSK